jgi:hypothetical protein
MHLCNFGDGCSVHSKDVMLPANLHCNILLRSYKNSILITHCPVIKNKIKLHTAYSDCFFPHELECLLNWHTLEEGNTIVAPTFEKLVVLSILED